MASAKFKEEFELIKSALVNKHEEKLALSDFRKLNSNWI